jgi:hypothetical protein
MNGAGLYICSSSFLLQLGVLRLRSFSTGTPGSASFHSIKILIGSKRPPPRNVRIRPL